MAFSKSKFVGRDKRARDWTAATARRRPSPTCFQACLLHDDILRRGGGNMVEVILVEVAVYCFQTVRRTVLGRDSFSVSTRAIVRRDP
jgi:hypothetical protein